MKGMIHLDLKQLTYFVTVAKTLSFSKAALGLHISQPSLSNSIANLEKEIGSSLFERTTRQLKLTDTGELLLERATSLLEQFSIMNEEIQDVVHGEEIEIVFGMIESAHGWFAKVMYDYAKKYPAVQFSVIDTLYNTRVVTALEKYHIHAAISNHRIQSPSITGIQLYTERFVVIFRKEHPLAKKEHITLKDLCDDSLITGMPKFETCKQILSAFDKLQLIPKIDYQIERFEMAKLLVNEGLGISILPENYIKNAFPDTLDYRVIEDNILARPVFLYYLKNRRFPGSVLTLFEEIQTFTKML